MHEVKPDRTEIRNTQRIIVGDFKTTLLIMTNPILSSE